MRDSLPQYWNPEWHCCISKSSFLGSWHLADLLTPLCIQLLIDFYHLHDSPIKQSTCKASNSSCRLFMRLAAMICPCLLWHPFHAAWIPKSCIRLGQEPRPFVSCVTELQGGLALPQTIAQRNLSLLLTFAQGLSPLEWRIQLPEAFSTSCISHAGKDLCISLMLEESLRLA